MHIVCNRYKQTDFLNKHTDLAPLKQTVIIYGIHNPDHSLFKKTYLSGFYAWAFRQLKNSHRDDPSAVAMTTSKHFVVGVWKPLKYF